MHFSIHHVAIDGYERRQDVAAGREAAGQVNLETGIGARPRDANERDTPVHTGHHVTAFWRGEFRIGPGTDCKGMRNSR